MDSRARHANEGPVREVDALGKLRSAIGALFVGRMLLGDLSELVGRALHGFAATAGIASGASAAAARGGSRGFQHFVFLSNLLRLFRREGWDQIRFGRKKGLTDWNIFIPREERMLFMN